MNKKVLLSALLGASLMAMPLTASAETSGSWDYVGHSVFKSQSVVVYSNGGDFQACLAGGYNWSGYLTLHEYDADNADETISRQYITPGSCAVWRSIGGYVDGSQAEFYVTKPSDGVTIDVMFYD